MSGLGGKVKGQLDLWCLYKSSVFNRFNIFSSRAGEGISEPLSDILYNMLSDELFKHPATQIESLVLSCR